MSFSRTEVAAACRKWGQHLWAPAGVDGPALLWAMSGNESSFGLNCLPRHEPAYCTGIYSHNPEVAKLTQEYGHGAHCSYGPWQILLVNCLEGTSPLNMASLDRAALETVSFMNRHVLKAQGASGVEEIAAAWNSGSPHHPNGLPPGVAKYVEQMRGYYDHEPMPQPVQAPELSSIH